MRALYYNNYVNTIRWEGDELLAESYFLSTQFEAAAVLRVDVRSFRVKEARWDIYRSPGGALNGGQIVPELNGIAAYFDGVQDIMKKTRGLGGGLPRVLFTECVKGLIQAETYVYKERGYPTTRDYDEYWNTSYLNQCRYYSNLDRVTLSWFDYVGDPHREGCIFNRYKNCAVYQTVDGTMVANGSFIDSFHELGVSMLLRKDGLITAVSGNFLRPPDPVCVESEQHLASLPGKFVTDLSKKDLAAVVGGAHGCAHLLDIVDDVCRAVTVVIQQLAHLPERVPLQ